MFVLSNFGTPESAKVKVAVDDLLDQIESLLAQSAEIHSFYVSVKWDEDRVIISVDSQNQANDAVVAFQNSPNYKVRDSNLGDSIVTMKDLPDFAISVSVTPRAELC